MEAVVNENVRLPISRPLLTDFCTHLPNLPDSTAEGTHHFTLERIQQGGMSFEEQVASMRERLASPYEGRRLEKVSPSAGDYSFANGTKSTVWIVTWSCP